MSKRAGAVSAETRQSILDAAREEFSLHGFQGSSLRRICAGAGVTTGAIYFFFSGKDELFETVMAGVTEPFLAFMRQHYAAERRGMAPGDRQQGDLEISRTLIDFYFQNRQVWDILLNHLNHPAVQRFLEGFVEESTDHYAFLLEQVHPVDRFAIHQFVHMQTDSMLTLISHDFCREEMLRHSAACTRMLQGAFQALLKE